MSDNNAGFTVKDILAQQAKATDERNRLVDERSDDRHVLLLKSISEVSRKVDVVDVKVDALRVRTETLEKDRDRRTILSGVSKRMVAAGATFALICLNIPVTLVYVHQI